LILRNEENCNDEQNVLNFQFFTSLMASSSIRISNIGKPIQFPLME